MNPFMVVAVASLSGRITQVDTVRQALVEDYGNRPGHLTVIGPARVAEDYISGGQILPRPVSPATIDVVQIQADGADEATVSGIPTDRTEAARVWIEGTCYDLPDNDSEFVYTVDQPGPYVVRVECFPYLDREFEIEGITPV